MGVLSEVAERQAKDFTAECSRLLQKGKGETANLSSYANALVRKREKVGGRKKTAWEKKKRRKQKTTMFN